MSITEVIENIHFVNRIWILLLPLILMGIDILTGLINAMWKEKNFQSCVMRQGLVKKCGEVAIILVGLVVTFGLTLPIYILKAISLYLIIMELMSIMENLDKMGVPVPNFVKSAINNIGSTVQNGDIEDIKTSPIGITSE